MTPPNGGRDASRLSDAGVRFIAGYEGFRSALYNDAADHCTIGYGHLIHHGLCNGSEPAHYRTGLSQVDALALLKEDAAGMARAVKDSVNVPLNQGQFDALVSFVFNVGPGNFQSSTLLRRLNAGDYAGVPRELKKWVNAGGRPLQGLIRRRAAEAELFARKPDAGAGTATPKAETTIDVAETLRKIGFPLPGSPTTKQLREAVSDFQRGWAFWNLEADGHVDPKTERALRTCVTNGGRCSENFWYREFASRGATDTTIKLRRELVIGLEEYRASFGPVTIVSGYRDPEHNHAVGGAANSQHLYGNGADIPQKATVAQVRALGRFSGIGYESSTGLVRHVDVRHVLPNTTGGSPQSPTVWPY